MDNLLARFQWLNDNYPLPAREHLIVEYEQKQKELLDVIIAMHQRADVAGFISRLPVRWEIREVFANRIESDTCPFCRGNNLEHSYSIGKATCRDCK